MDQLVFIFESYVPVQVEFSGIETETEQLDLSLHVPVNPVPVIDGSVAPAKLDGT